jgi:tRNA pseudouridine32 synthase/23S rRNA pseudouridine746 synthase/23S rRNA pseudouridine1911/1915/1917 synthase
MKALEAASALYPDSSNRTLLNWIKAGRFYVDGNPLKRANLDLAPGQTISAQTTFKPQPIPGLKILYEDRFLVAIDKPSGLLSVPLDEELLNNGQVSRHALGLLRQHYDTEQIFAVHRIDRDTSGCLIFARGKQSEEALKDLFEKHDLTREYFAILEGRMDATNGVWESRLLELENYDVVESDEGKDAITHYEVLHRSPKYTYIKLRLETGRKHQIRVHCSTAGFPVLGDERYGSKEDPAKRVCLHAWNLELIHPLIKNKKISVSSPVPHAFKKLGGGRFL